MDSNVAIELRPIFITWEKLRLVYNAVLAMVVGLIIVIDPGTTSSEKGFWWLALKGCIEANILYTAGPALEAYVNYLARRRVRLTWVLFIPGTFLAILLTFAAVGGEVEWPILAEGFDD